MFPITARKMVPTIVVAANTTHPGLFTFFARASDIVIIIYQNFIKHRGGIAQAR
jgi:hypothetical protein